MQRQASAKQRFGVLRLDLRRVVLFRRVVSVGVHLQHTAGTASGRLMTWCFSEGQPPPNCNDSISHKSSIGTL